MKKSKFTEAQILKVLKTQELGKKVTKSGFKSFNTISRTIMNHYNTILNYFDNRSTNASAESFNAKIKAFRSHFRGVRNVEFFLFRLSKIYV
jgi:transposase